MMQSVAAVVGRGVLVALLMALNGCVHVLPFSASDAMADPRELDPDRIVYGDLTWIAGRIEAQARNASIGGDFDTAIADLRLLAHAPAPPVREPPPYTVTGVGHMWVDVAGILDGLKQVMVFRPYRYTAAPVEHGIVVIAPGIFASRTATSVDMLIRVLQGAGYDVLVYVPPLHDQQLALARARPGTTPRLFSVGVREAEELAALGCALRAPPQDDGPEGEGQPPPREVALIGLSIGGLTAALVQTPAGHERDPFATIIAVAAPTGGLDVVFAWLHRLADRGQTMFILDPLFTMRPAQVMVAKFFAVALALMVRAAGIKPDAQPGGALFAWYLEHLRQETELEPLEEATQETMLARLAANGATAVYFEQDVIATAAMEAAARKAQVKTVLLQGGHLAPADPAGYLQIVLDILKQARSSGS